MVLASRPTPTSAYRGVHRNIYPQDPCRLVAAQNPPPPVGFARKGANPTLKTIEQIRMILRSAGGPVSRNQILARLSSSGHGTSRQALNVTIEFLAADGLVIEGSKGLQWVPQAEGSILETIRKKRKRS